MIRNLASYLARSCEVLPNQPSSLRVIVLFGMLAIIWVWLMACIWSRSIVAIPGSVLTLVGALLGAKVAQTPFEDSSISQNAKTSGEMSASDQTQIQ